MVNSKSTAGYRSGGRAASRLTWVALSLATVVACGSNGGNTDGSDVESTGGVGSGATSATGGMGGGESRLSDPQIFKVLDTIHESRVAEAKLASLRATSEEVADFANSIMATHEKAAADLAALEERRSITPADSKTSLTLAAVSSVEVDTLTGAASAEFDQAYLQAQIGDHGRVVSLIATLLDQATDAELENSIHALKMMTNEHHARAQMILSAL